MSPLSDLAAKLLEHRREIKANANAVLATLEDAGARQIPITPELVAAIPVLCAQLARDNSPRVKAKAVQLMLAASKYNLDRAIHADKAGRLDSGQATERVDVSANDAKRERMDALLDSDPEAMDAALALGRKLAAGGMPDALPSDT